MRRPGKDAAVDRGVEAVKTTSRRHVLGAVLAAGGAAACAVTNRILPVSIPDPVRYDACRARGQKTFSVLTWNVFMMPEWVRESPRNVPRAAAIAAALLEHEFDILCLQKVFDSAAREVLEAALAASYPYRFGPANDDWSLKLNSGVWVLSRHPMTDYQTIQFDDCANVECWSRKGAILLSGSCAGTPFRLITTHLQGEEGPAFTASHQRVRDAQMAQIRDQLVRPHLEPRVPFLFCGDLGTPRFTDDGQHETASYKEMLQTFNAENGAEARFTLSDSLLDNDMATDDTGRKNELDYILIAANGRPVSIQRARYVLRRQGWDTPPSVRSDLSYRYAVGATVAFGAPESPVREDRR
jgi:endonuclease/exonuclease/phosphatase family metal-dependent hydrolase